MGDGGDVVADLEVFDGGLAGFHAVEEIAGMLGAHGFGGAGAPAHFDHGTAFEGFSDDFPAAGIEDEGGIGTGEHDAMLAAVGTEAALDLVFPDERVGGEVVDGDLGVGGFGIVLKEVLAAGGDDALRPFGAHGPESDVDEVDAPVGHETAGIVPEPAEVEVEAVFVEGAGGCGAEPEVVIDAGGDGGVGGAAGVLDPVEVGPAADLADFADLSGADQFDGFGIVLAAAPVGAHLGDAIVAAGGIAEDAAFADGGGEGLFDVNILASLEGGEGGDGVPVIGGADGDDVDVLAFDDTAEVFRGGGAGVAFGFEAFEGVGDALVINVADGGDLDFPGGEEGVGDGTGDAAAADDAEANAVVRGGAGGGGGGEGALHEEAAGGGHGDTIFV